MAIVNANTGYADIKASSVLTKAQSSRIGVILQPSELTGTSPVLALYSVGNGYAEYYQFFIQEISATEYSEGLNVVMARYHYRTNGVLSTNGVTMSSVRRNKLNLDKAVADTNVSKITVQSDSIIVTPSAADARIKIPCKLSAGSYIPTIISGSTMIARNSSDANVSNSANDGVVMNVTAETSYIYWYLSNSNTNPITLYKNAIQLEPGTSKTPVEPYNVTTATIPVELKSVNVVQDEFSDCDWLPDGTPVLLGYWRHTQRVEVAANVASGTAINTANFPLAKNGSTFDLYLTAGGKQTGIVGTDTASGAGTLYYELVVPIVSKIEGVPNIDVYPGGSIYVEPVIEEEQRPTAGVITIKNTSLPIKLVRYVKEVTILPDGSRQYKDVSWTNTTTTISPTGADNTKFYLYAYERDSSLPKIKYSYGINESALMQDTAKGLTALSQSVAEFAEFAVAFFVNIEARLTAKGI
jgi:hypothetical protein